MDKEVKGRSSSRFWVKVSAVVLGLLFYGLLNFILEDLGTIHQPNYQKIQAKHVSQSVLDQEQQLNNEINAHNNQIKRLSDNQQYIKNNADNLKTTIDQMLDIQKSSLQKNITVSEKDKASFNEAQNVFLSYQNQFKTLNDDILNWQKSKHILEGKLDNVHTTLDQQRKLADKEYSQLSEKHRFFQAKLQVSTLLIILLFSLLLLRRYYTNAYSIILKAFCLATFILTFLTIHEFFPSQYFKYLLIGALILTVIYLMTKLIQSIKSPKLDMLIKQYREAYEHFLCPVCEFPIHMGPRRFLFWTRRSNVQLKLPKTKESHDFEIYHCPACSTELFNQCSSCQQVRYSLLPSCSHCGHKNTDSQQSA
ncbi:MAG: hypothetical protein K2X50_10325 [Gammaproteobacteria bacterium]|nr:hypothetical protein [Gammaproteobacteria bacterium]